MRLTAQRTLAALLLALLPLPALAFELWNGTASGMSAAQVQKAHPDAAPNPMPDSLANKAEDLLVDPHVGFAGGVYRARYFFLDGKLMQVTLTLDVAASGPGEMKTFFAAARDALSEQFGAPSKEQGPSGVISSRYYANWDGAPLRLSVLAYQDTPELLNINFQDASYWD